MYVNDILNYINHCTAYFFVDDAKCIQIIDQPSDCTLMQVNLSKWNDKWKLLLNSSKCCTMTFSSSTDTQSYIYHINNHPLQSLTKHKDLYISPLISRGDLIWSLSVQQLINNQALIQLYLTLVRPHLILQSGTHT